jgi:cell division control protein 6
VAVSAFSRVKRLARGEIFNDENENPSIVQITGDEVQCGVSMDVDEVPEGRSRPAKHGHAGKLIALSPSKIRTHFDEANSDNGKTHLLRTKHKADTAQTKT